MSHYDYEAVLEVVDATTVADEVWITEGIEDWQFYSGEQWTQAEKDAANKKNKPFLTINTTKPHVRVLKGFERLNRNALQVVPVDDHPEADEVSTALTKAMSAIMRSNHSGIIMSRAFGMGMICGRGYSGGFIDFSEDPFGQIKHFPIDPFDVGFDLTSQAPDMSDMQYIYRAVYLTDDEVLDRYPNVALKDLKMLKAVDGESSFRDRYFASKTFDSDDYEPNRVGTPPNDELMRLHELRGSNKLLEFWSRDREKTYFVADPTTGAFEQLESKVAAESLAAIVPGSFVIDHNVPRNRVQVLGPNGIELENELSLQEGLQFPIFPYIADTETMVHEGVVRGLKDPQRDRNKRRSQLLHILSRLPQAGMFIEEGVIKDWAEFDDNLKEPGFRQIVNDIHGILPYKMDTVPSFVFQMEREAANDMEAVSGVNPDLLGFQDKNPSGRAISLRQQQGLTIHGDAFDNLRLTYLMFGRWLLASIQSFYTYQKVFHLVASDGTFDRIVLNEHDDMTGRIINNITNRRFDVVIDEAAQTPTTRLALFHGLVDLLQYGVPIDGATIIQHSPFPEKASIIAGIERAQEAEREARLSKSGQGGSAPTGAGRA